MMNYLWVALGSMVGGVSRFWISGLVASRMGTVFPWNTLVINVTGSFVIGILGAWTAPEGPLNGPQRTTVTSLLMVGLCGGYTTFSSFSMETVNLIQAGNMAYAALNIVLSLILCLSATWMGVVIGRVI